PPAALAHVGVVAVGELLDELVGPDGAGRGLDLLPARAGPAEGDVVRDGAGEQVRLLGDHHDVAGEVLHRDVPQVHAVQRHPTLGGVVEAGDELGDRGLAGTGLAHQGDGLAGGDVQVHRLQHQRAVLGVAEGNVLEVDLPARGG